MSAFHAVAEALLPRSLRTFVQGYHRPNVEETVNETGAQNTASDGSLWDPSDVDNEYEPTTSSSRSPSQSTPPGTPQVPQTAPYSAKPATNSRQRMRPRGILLGKWNASGIRASSKVNVVYGSRDAKNRINRRVVKIDEDGNVVLGGNYHRHQTACKHENNDYNPEFTGMTKTQVDSHIMPLLVGQEVAEIAQNPAPAPALRAERVSSIATASSASETVTAGSDIHRRGAASRTSGGDLEGLLRLLTGDWRFIIADDGNMVICMKTNGEDD